MPKASIIYLHVEAEHNVTFAQMHLIIAIPILVQTH
jgi:hypothetical protein